MKMNRRRVLTGIDRATSGDVWVGERNVGKKSSRGLRRLRRDVVGYVFQRPSDNFLPNLTIGADRFRVTFRSTVTVSPSIVKVADDSDPWGAYSPTGTNENVSPAQWSSGRR